MRGKVSPYPARGRTAWILAQRPPRPAVRDPNVPHGVFLERERLASGDVADSGVVLLTNRECPWRCLMCDLWKDTTTLYTKLHKGTDATGEVVGAGILSLGVTDLIKLLGTVEVPNAGPVQRAETLAKFGKFFMGELWNTYAKHLR